MTGIAIAHPGGPDALVEKTLPLPPFGPREILIRVAASGVNAPDIAQRQGAYDPPPGHSPVPGLEVAGEIAAVGAEVSGFAIGDWVVALCNGGGYAEFAAMPAGQVLPMPVGWNCIAGAALPETYFTIQQTLVLRAGLTSAMSVLIHGAAGGIGGAAIVLSRLAGATPIAVVSSPEKAAYARTLGAAAVIDHTREDFVARTRELTEGRGADRIIAIEGGEMLARNISAAARGATIVQLAGRGGVPSTINVGHLLVKWLTIIGSTLRPQPPEAKAVIAASLRHDVWPALEQGIIGPPRLQTFPMRAAPEAHRAMETRANFGKIVLITPFGATLEQDISIANRKR